MQEEQEKMLTYAVLGVIGYAKANNKDIDFATAMQQTMQLDSNVMQEIASNQDLVKAGVRVMQQNEPEILSAISQPGGMAKVVQSMQQPQSAKHGAKLEYIKMLKGICPEGYELSYMAKGGTVCQVCKKAKQGTKVCKPKVKKHQYGGISEVVNNIRADVFKCGGKTKKMEEGGKPQEPKKVLYKDKEGNEYEYNDSTELKEHIALIKKFQQKKKLTPAENKRLGQLNGRQVSANFD